MNQTAEENVLYYLFERENTWVPGYKLTHPSIGGSEGLRRLRHARAKGWPIEKRRMANSRAYEYRLVV